MLYKLGHFLESQGGILSLFALFLLLFSGLIVYVGLAHPANEKTFAYLTGLGSGFSGGIFTVTRIQSRKERPTDSDGPIEGDKV